MQVNQNNYDMLNVMLSLYVYISNQVNCIYSGVSVCNRSYSLMFYCMVTIIM